MENEQSLMGAADESDFVKSDPDVGHEINLREEKQAPTFERPEDLPVEFWDEETGSFKGQDLYKAYKTEKDKALGLRQKISKGLPKAPQSVDEYKLDLGEGVELGEDDQGITAFKGVALEAGLTQEQFNKVIGGFKKAHDDGLFGNDDDAVGLTEEQHIEAFQKEKAKLGKDADKVINNLKSWGKQLYQEGVLSKEDLESYMDLGINAGQIRVLDKLRQSAGYITDIPVGADPIDGSMSYEEAISRMKDPRYETDAAFRKPIDEFFQRNYK